MYFLTLRFAVGLCLAASLAQCIVVRFSTPKRLKCWACEDAGSDAHCFRIGRWIKCQPTEYCYIEQRYANGYEVHKRGCKQDTACDALIAQNDFQCNATMFKELLKQGIRSPLTCRHCCTKNFCNPTEKDRIEMDNIFGKEPASFPLAKPKPTKKPVKKPTTQSTTAGPRPKLGENLGEVFYPGVGWIALSRVEEDRPTPPAPLMENPRKSSKGNVSQDVYNDLYKPVGVLEAKRQKRRRRQKKRCTSNINPIQPSPEKMKPKDECLIQAPVSCVADGTLVIKFYKIEGAGLMFEKSATTPTVSDLSEVICHKTPSMDTVAVYDNNDHYVMIMRINNRGESRLPQKQKRRHFIGDDKLMDIVTSTDIARYRGGNG